MLEHCGPNTMCSGQPVAFGHHWGIGMIVFAARLPLRFLAPAKLRLPKNLDTTILYECIFGAVSLQEILTLTLLRQMYSVA